MRLRILLFITLLSFAGIPVAAQGILPKSFAGWVADASTPSEAISAEVSQAPQPVLAEYGWTQTESRQYLQGKSMLTVSLHKLKDPSGSYGLYSFLRTPDMPRAELAEHSSISPDHALALIGNLVVEVRGKELAKSRREL